MANLNSLDYVLLFIIGFSTIVGLSRGLVRQVFDLVAWVLSIYMAIGLGPTVAAELNRVLGLEAHLNKALGPIWGNFSVGSSAVNILGFILVLMVVRLIVEVVANMVDFVAKLPVINMFNRLGGAAFGFTKGLAVVFIIAALIKAMPAGEFTQTIESSRVVSSVVSLSPALYEQIKQLIARVRPLA